MAYDENLADRFRDVLGLMDGLSEKKMMGGLCFLYQGNMIGGVAKDKQTLTPWLMFRIGKENDEEAFKRPDAHEMDMTGRKMGGMIKVYGEDCSDADLKYWVSLAMSFVSQLPAKAPKKKK